MGILIAPSDVSNHLATLEKYGLPSTPNKMNKDRVKGVNPRCGSALKGVERLGGAVVIATTGGDEDTTEDDGDIVVRASDVGALVEVEGNCSFACSVREIVEKEEDHDSEERLDVVGDSANDRLEAEEIEGEIERLVLSVE